jgi:hypothetical protein
MSIDKRGPETEFYNTHGNEIEDIADALVPQYEAGYTLNSFKLAEIRALEEYAKDLDMVRACAAAGYKAPRKAAFDLMQRKHILEEIREIHAIWKLNLRMSAKHSSAKHIELMQKFERDYDELDSTVQKGTSNIKGQLAGTLGRMSDSMLKATGHFDDKSGGSAAGIVINIDLGDGTVEVDKDGKRAVVKRTKEQENENGNLHADRGVRPDGDNELPGVGD